MSFRVRLAQPSDDHAIGELLVEAYVDTYRRKMPEVVVIDSRKKDLRDVAQKREIATVLVLEQTPSARIVGTIALFPPGAPGSEAWLARSVDIRHLALAVGFHGQGLSSLLLDEVEKIAREKMKADSLCLHVRKGADGVARLYERRGFKRAPEGDLSFPHVELEAYVFPLIPK